MPITKPCSGPCNSPARRAWNAYEQALKQHATDLEAWHAGELGEAPDEPLPPDVEVRQGDPLWCPRCKTLVRVALLDLDNLAAELQAGADGHRGALAEGRVSGSRGSGTPSPTADLLDNLYGFLADVEDEWRDTWGYSPRTDRVHRGAHPRTRRITWLSERLEGILAAEQHVTFGIGVLRWEVVLREKLKEDSVGTRSPIRCPKCSERRVVRQREGYWQCGSCTMMLSDPVERQQRHDQGVELETAGAGCG